MADAARLPTMPPMGEGMAIPIFHGMPLESPSTRNSRKVASVESHNRLSTLSHKKIVLKQSLVWSISLRGFSKYDDPRHSTLIICNECLFEGKTQHAEFNYSRDRSTGNVKHHLQVHHPDIHDNLLLAMGQKTAAKQAAQNQSTDLLIPISNEEALQTCILAEPRLCGNVESKSLHQSKFTEEVGRKRNAESLLNNEIKRQSRSSAKGKASLQSGAVAGDWDLKGKGFRWLVGSYSIRSPRPCLEIISQLLLRA